MKTQPWLSAPAAADTLQEATVIGAGIAGAAVARQLAERGCKVQVFESEAPGSGASGNPAAVLRPVLARSLKDPLACFTTDAFVASKSKVLQLCREGHDIAHAFDGVLHCHPAPDALQGTLQHEVWGTDRARLMLGAAAQQGGAWLPDAGWVSPVDYIRALLQHTNIELTQAELGSLQHDGLGWRLYDPEGRHFQDSALVVLANGWQLNALAPTAALPLSPVVSQLLHFEPTESLAPRAPIVGPATICPSATGFLAAAGHWPKGNEPGETERQAELRSTAKQLWAGLDAKASSARSPTRAASRDHLPVVGGVPDFALASELYADLRHGRPAHHYPEPPYLDGLYVLGALGGRGITTAQLCAELLVETITGGTHPWQAATHPLRFLVRELKRKQSDD